MKKVIPIVLMVFFLGSLFIISTIIDTVYLSPSVDTTGIGARKYWLCLSREQQSGLLEEAGFLPGEIVSLSNGQKGDLWIEWMRKNHPFDLYLIAANTGAGGLLGSIADALIPGSYPVPSSCK